MATNCPCSLDSICEKDCCVEALRAIHRERLAKVKDSVTKESKFSVSSYGSMDNRDDRQPLLTAKRNLVSLVDLVPQ